MAEPTPPDTSAEMDAITSADGTEIAFERTGSGPPFVLVHGGGGANDHTRWELAGVRPAFAEHYTVYEMDCRGRGASGDAEEYEFDATRFADVTTPTVLLSGGESPPFYRDAIEAVADALPNSRIVTFEGQQHVAMLTATDRFIDEVLAFIGESN